ncbi:MAG: DHA1 family bicyclomycin/chloramphenicol resistance-like MFS transporter [Gammaproteobacteria bacterium]|jgi:DHA1 family bicyclomycin/chloramphenicol resistance-like MFS transporter
MQQLKNQGISELEFIALMAFLMANAALSIDGILPGLNDIGLALNHSNPRDLQSIVTMIFLGLGMGQLVFGTLSDSLGRKPVVYAGVVVFLLASLISVQATTLEMMLFGRFLQGVGLSAPRSVSISIIRDLYEGDYMARIMSFITVIFILVPMIAPILGQFILDIYYWQAIFYFQMFFALVTLIWFGLRLKETVPKSKRIQLTKHLFVDGVKEFFKFKETIIYTLISGLITSSFMVYLSSSKQIFQDQYGLIKEFAYLFAGIAFFLGLATFFNGNLVVKYGMKKLATTALYMFTFSGLVYTLLFFNKENPDVYVLLPFLAMQFLCIGFIFGNIRALAMQPIGHIAGVGASLNGFISTMMAVPLAILIGRFIDETALPLFVAFLCCGVVSILLLYVLENLKREEG